MFSKYNLQRTPKEPLLKAWNAADELFCLRFDDLLNEKTLIINDTFGALAVRLEHPDNIWWSDSAMSLEALKQNSSLNDNELPTIISMLDKTIVFDQVVLQIPKSVPYFEYQLEQILISSNSNIRVFALGMVKHISSGHIKVMNKYFNVSNPGKAEKKARVIELSQPIFSELDKHQSNRHSTKYDVPELDLTISTEPGCYAQSKVDPGARVFIEQFNLLPKVGSALDLGCGNGILALALLKQQPDIDLHLVDDSFQAIESVKENLQASGFNSAHYWHNNSLNGLSEISNLDLVLCNPPFHQENTLTEKIAQKMLKDAYHVLGENGELWIVANRHLNYKTLLSKMFSRAYIVTSGSKFNVIRCIK